MATAREAVEEPVRGLTITEQARLLGNLSRFARLAETVGTKVLTVNGEAEGISSAPYTFDKLTDDVERAQAAAVGRHGGGGSPAFANSATRSEPA